jgi:hypothetical protein
MNFLRGLQKGRFRCPGVVGSSLAFPNSGNLSLNFGQIKLDKNTGKKGKDTEIRERNSWGGRHKKDTIIAFGGNGGKLFNGDII